MDIYRRRALALLGSASITAVAGCSGIAAPGQSFEDRTGLTADDGGTGDNFGHEVAVSADGSTVLVGASRADTPDGTETGAAYVFERTDGSWTQNGKLVPETIEEKSMFGFGVALSADGRTAVVGCAFDERRETRPSGAVYVFERVDGEWIQRARLIEDMAADPADRSAAYTDALGESVAVSADGETVLAGAPFHAVSGSSGAPPVSGGSDFENLVASVWNPIGPAPGAAFVFERSDGEWHQTAKFATGEWQGQSHVGSAVALTADGSKAFVASQGRSSVSVFERVDGSWTEASALPIDDDVFLRRDGVIGISTDGTTAVTGDYGGPAAVFEWADCEWTRSATLEASPTEDPWSNANVALSGDGDTALIVRESGERKNAVEAFTRSGSSWSRKTVLTTGDDRPEMGFGASLALSGDATTAVVGAAGAAFVFE
ncbi:quinoprotein (ISS); K06485 integrin alpha 6 [Halorhabdus utahensis DSM 12940]|uniref:Quinoprotein (ISS) K06485 integrin alpha 6 n=1 Tax=Halorhabdus utahensis (strain DSM 12940 / JCM 11049 / AX-2) TaxID=519442 RepID=C7NUI2_HALUD|nr:FG-GAP repeat protein [Halorhabdus utahensis]ACV12339.1 quinoprotein (ISS); K06485 integrin alpha 6 [Halorhabdus utahensis DSM 12940]